MTDQNKQQISVDWKEATLGDYISIKHGFAFKGEYFSEQENENVLLTPGNFNIGGGFKANKFKYYIGSFPEEYILRAGDLIVTMTDLSKDGDTLGYPAKVPHYENRNFLHNQRIGLVQFKRKDLDRDFLYYLMCTRNYQKSLVNSASGSTVRHTSPNKIREHKSLFPSFPEQQAIASVLSAFDDKIELLREQNKTLEAIAQTLFNRWFVEFNFPDENGQPYLDSGGRTIDSELGEIPEGWEVGRLDDVIDYVVDNRGKTPPLSEKGYKLLEGFNIFCEETFPVFYQGEKQKKVSEKIYGSWFRKGHPEYLDILCATVGTLPKWCFAPKNIDFCIAQNIISLRVNREVCSPFYIKHLFNSHYFINLFNGRLITAVQPSIKVPHMLDMPIIIPEKLINKQFDDLIDPFYDEIHNNYSQIQTLSQFRDTLLPKLMRGEVRVKGF